MTRAVDSCFGILVMATKIGDWPDWRLMIVTTKWGCLLVALAVMVERRSWSFDWKLAGSSRGSGSRSTTLRLEKGCSKHLLANERLLP